MKLDREMLDRLNPTQANAIVILQALLEYQSPPDQEKLSLEPSLAVEACIVAAAALLETGYDIDLDEEAARRAANLKDYVRQFRKEFDVSGETALEQLGASTVTRERLQ